MTFVGFLPSVVVGTEHLRRHRLAEAAAARHATETLFREKRLVDNGNESRLVDVFTIEDSLESRIADIDICAHRFRFFSVPAYRQSSAFKRQR